jgi:hypothetical protein
MMTPEGKVKAEIKQGLTAHGVYFFMPVPMGFGKRTLDFLCCWRGQFIAIEAKAGDKELTTAQAIIADEIRAARGKVIVAYSWADVEHELRRL